MKEKLDVRLSNVQLFSGIRGFAKCYSYVTKSEIIYLLKSLKLLFLRQLTKTRLQRVTKF